MKRRRRSGPYKRYLRDPDAGIPRTTAWHWHQQKQIKETEQVAACSDSSPKSDSDDASSNISLHVNVRCQSSSSMSIDKISCCSSEESIYSRVDSSSPEIVLKRKILILEEKVSSLEKEMACFRRLIAGSTCSVLGGEGSGSALSQGHEHSTCGGSMGNFRPCSDGPLSSKNILGTRKEQNEEGVGCGRNSLLEDMLQFGSQKIAVSQVNHLRDHKDTILAAELCTLVFSPCEMAMCSMKGKINNKSRVSFKKQPIDQSKVKAIIHYICQLKGVSGADVEKRLRKAIQNKLCNFCKTEEGKSIILQHMQKQAS